jgi:SPFH domain / Band 7 family
VPQARAYVIERLGSYGRTLDAGLNTVVPFIDRVRARIDLREQVVSFAPQPVITEDNLVVHIDTVLYFQVTDLKAATYEIANFIRAPACALTRQESPPTPRDGSMTPSGSRDTASQSGAPPAGQPPARPIAVEVDGATAAAGVDPGARPTARANAVSTGSRGLDRLLTGPGSWTSAPSRRSSFRTKLLVCVPAGWRGGKSAAGQRDRTRWHASSALSRRPGVTGRAPRPPDHRQPLGTRVPVGDQPAHPGT